MVSFKSLTFIRSLTFSRIQQASAKLLNVLTIINFCVYAFFVEGSKNTTPIQARYIIILTDKYYVEANTEILFTLHQTLRNTDNQGGWRG